MAIRSMRRPRTGEARRAVHVALGAFAVLLGALALAACGSTTTANNSSAQSGSTATQAAASTQSGSAKVITAQSVNPTTLAATIKHTFLAPVPTSELDPVTLNTLAVASVPLTSAQNKLLATCLHESSCDTGHGTLTVAINRDAPNSFSNEYRAEATAQALQYPQIKRILYADTTNGSITAALADLRSFIAQKVNILVEDPELGAGLVPVLAQAKRDGITVVTVNSPLPANTVGQVNTQIPFDLCSMGTAAGKAVSSSASGAKSYALYTGIAGNPDAAQWQPCAKRTLQSAGWSQATQGFTQWTPQGESQAASALLSSGKAPGAIFYDASVDDFLKPYIAAHKAPPASFADAARFSLFNVYQQAKAAGLNPAVYVSNGHSWYGRLGVTAAMMQSLGDHVPALIQPPTPVVSLASILNQNVAGIPADAYIPTLLTPAQLQLAESVSS